MILQVALQLALPVVLVAGLFRGRFQSRTEWILNVLVCSGVLFFVFLTARWDFTSYYLRYAWPVLLAVSAFHSYKRIAPGETATPRSTLVANGIIAAVFWGLSFVALLGSSHPDDVLALTFPLRDGTYYVGGGGNARLINNHQAHLPQQFAIDVVRLGSLGNRASSIAPGRLEQFVIFGDTIYSPCSGTVVAAVDGMPDLNPPERDQTNLAGNHVILSCDDAKVVLAHMLQGSVAVAVGDTVDTDRILGRVGNSGNTTQPHLHLHAERGGPSDEILTGTGIPVTFGGRFLVRNSVVR